MRLAMLLLALILSLLVAGAARSDEPEPLTLTPAQVEELKAQIRQWVGQAYEAGKAESKAACISLI